MKKIYPIFALAILMCCQPDSKQGQIANQQDTTKTKPFSVQALSLKANKFDKALFEDDGPAALVNYGASADFLILRGGENFVGDNLPHVIGQIVHRTELDREWAKYDLYGGIRHIKSGNEIKEDRPSEKLPFTDIYRYKYENKDEVGFLGLKFSADRSEGYEVIKEVPRKVYVDPDGLDYKKAYERVKDQEAYKSFPDQFGVVFSARVFHYSIREGKSMTTTKTVKLPIVKSLFNISGSTFESVNEERLTNEYRVVIGVMPINKPID